jgi:hypothetical protein
MNKMISEFKERIQKFLKGADFTDERKLGIMQGAHIMYAELAPIVEWISVEVRLPEERTIVLVKTIYNKYYDSFLLDGKWVIGRWITENPYFVGEITHWRKIGL